MYDYLYEIAFVILTHLSQKVKEMITTFPLLFYFRRFFKLDLQFFLLSVIIVRMV